VPSPAQIFKALLSLQAVAGEVLRCGVPADARFLSSHLVGHPFLSFIVASILNHENIRVQRSTLSHLQHAVKPPLIIRL
jgi:hypothetical protein